MAVTTQISDVDWRRPHLTRDVPKLWFGHEVPEGVTAINMMFNALEGQLMVRWRVKGDPVIHEMPFEQTNECAMAALAAMKLTC